MSEEQPAAFEASLAELEDILRGLEDGTASLEESIARYERGVGLLKLCYGQLRDAEVRVSRLAGTDEDGKPVLKPFDAEPHRNGRPAE